MELTLSQAAEIYAGLRSLRGTFGGKARYALGKNLVILSRVVDDLRKKQLDLKAKHVGEGEIAPGSEAFKAFSEEYRDMVNEVVDLPGLREVPFAELDLEKNEIPLNVLNSIIPLLAELPVDTE